MNSVKEFVKVNDQGNGKGITIEKLESEIMSLDEARVFYSETYSGDEETEYEKFLNLPIELGRLAEFINGQIYFLPMPNIKHQRLSRRLATRFSNYLYRKTCEIFIPVNVKIDFDFDPDSRTTLRPDLLVICNKEKIEEQGIRGAPDLIVEILMLSNANHDKTYKYHKYLSAGVIEYWIVDPIREVIIVHLLNDDGRYEKTTYVKGDVIKVFILDDLYIDVKELFEGYPGEIPEVKAARKEERGKAIEMEKLAREEERKRAVEMEKLARKEEREKSVEMEKLATIRRLLEMGLSNSEVARGAEVDLDVVLRVSKELDNSNE